MIEEVRFWRILFHHTDNHLMPDADQTIEQLKKELERREAEIEKLRGMIELYRGDTPEEAEVKLSVMHEVLSEGARIASLGGWQHNLESGKSYWSPEVFRIYGVPEGEVPDLEEGIGHYAEKDRERIRKAFTLLASDGTPYDMECELFDAHGEKRFVRVVGRVREMKGGKPRVLCGIIQDVTDQHTMQRGMEAFFSLTPDFVGAINFDHRPVTLSPSWEKTLGWSQYKMIRLGIDCVVEKSGQEAMRDLIRRAIDTGRIESTENRVVSKEGRYFWFSWRFFADPATELVFVSARDVTRRKDTEEALKEAKVQAELANRAKSDFLAIMSHELRTPLNPILGFADLLISEIEDEEHLEILQAISQAGQNLTNVIGDVLDFAKIESGRAEVEEDEFVLKDLLEKQIRLMQGQVRGKPVDLQLDYQSDPALDDKLVLLADKEKITRVIFNLLGNAIKFTEEGSVRLDSYLSDSGDQRAIWHLDVSDTGIGISRKALEGIFEPFSQADTSTTRQYGGTGLGLAICKRLIELMGGEITVSSRIGEGTTFSILLPLKIGTRKAEQSPASDHRAKKLSGKPKILVVEDNATNSYYLTRVLGQMDCQVTSVISGEEALAHYVHGAYGMILLDIHMPGINGIDVLRRIRAEESEKGLRPVPIVMLTADVLPQTREQCMQLGANGFLTKPVRGHHLSETLAGILGQAAV